MEKRPKRREYQPRLTRMESEQALRLLQHTMAKLGVRSVYALLALTPDLNPSTLYRWFADAELGYVVELPIKAVREIANSLGAKHSTHGRSVDLEALLDSAERREAQNAELLESFRAYRIPYARALAAIRAAGHRLVPIDDGAQE
jgi:hypothetical protein